MTRETSEFSSSGFRMGSSGTGKYFYQRPKSSEDNKLFTLLGLALEELNAMPKEYRYTEALTPDTVLRLYREGFFPMPREKESALRWIRPEFRGVLFFSKFYVPRSWRKVLRREDWTVTMDKDFPQVVKTCQRVHQQRSGGTWLRDELVQVFLQLHEAGLAHSVEVWNEEGSLIGGQYGLDVDGVFCGESMFYLESGASKRALVHLIEYLDGRGATWIDTQMVTTLFETAGAEYIPNQAFMKLFGETRNRGLRLFD